MLPHHGWRGTPRQGRALHPTRTIAHTVRRRCWPHAGLWGSFLHPSCAMCQPECSRRSNRSIRALCCENVLEEGFGLSPCLFGVCHGRCGKHRSRHLPLQRGPNVPTGPFTRQVGPNMPLGHAGKGGAQHLGHGRQAKCDHGFWLEGFWPFPVKEQAFAAMHDQRSFHTRPAFGKARKVDSSAACGLRWTAAGRGPATTSTLPPSSAARRVSGISRSAWSMVEPCPFAQTRVG